MDIVKSYNKISWYFSAWVRLMEIHTREMEIVDSNAGDLNILIISPPTDFGIKLLAQNNADGRSYLLCFTTEMGKTAKKYLSNHKIINIITSDFFNIPFDNGYFDAIFTNCFFDFCQEKEFVNIIFEIQRVLKNKAMFFSVYMDFPSNFLNHIWNSIFNNLPFLSQGCHPINIKPTLLKCDFRLKKDISLSRFGFPIKYIMAEKL